MAELRGSGLRIELPPGWDGEIYRRAPSDAGRHPQETTHTVLHAASFPLPPQRGDFGDGAIEAMGLGDVLVVLFEYGPESLGTALFERRGIPLPLDLDDFHPNRLHEPARNQAAAQYFFTAARRPFCLYVVVGSFRLRSRLVPLAEAALGSLRFEGGKPGSGNVAL